MTEIKTTRKRVRDIVRTIDEIAFQTSILTLNAAIEATAGQGSRTRSSTQPARETLALIEESITHSPFLAGVEGAGMAETLQRIRCAAPPVGMRQPLSDVR
jgi:hypothetical protein